MAERMGHTPAIPKAADPAPTDQRQRHWAAAVAHLRAGRRDPAAARSRRVVLLVVLIWIIGLFDLASTLLAQRIGGFVEANPVVAQVAHAWEMLVGFKLVTLTFASVVLVKYRRRRLTEFSCWALCVVHVFLAFLWLRYFATLH